VNFDFNMRKCLEWDSLAPIYDLVWPRSEDFGFYLQQAACQGDPILEIGCGTGRLSCHLAEQGYNVVGIDISQGQIRQAEKRHHLLSDAARNRLALQVEDAAVFVRPNRFALVIAAFSTMFEVGGPEARVRIYERAHENLRAGGKLAIDNSFIGTAELAHWGKPRPSGVRQLLRTFREDGSESRDVFCYETQVYSGDLMVLTLALERKDPDGSVRETQYTVTRHYATPEQTITELSAAGFTEIEVYGGYEQERIGDPALQGRGRQVFLARKTL